MKHPALTRALAAVLVIMCVIMLVAGALGIAKAESKYSSDKDDYEKLSERITTYNELTAKLDGKKSYAETSDELDARQEEHDEDAADYRSDLAERTATQGGYEKGAAALWEAKSEVDSAMNGYQQAKAVYDAAKLEFEQQKAQADAVISQCNEVAAACSAADAVPLPEEPGEEPTAVADPSTTWTEEQIAADPDGYAAATEAYNAYVQQKAEYDTKKAAYDGVVAQKQAVLDGANAMLNGLGLGSADSLSSASAMLSGYAGTLSSTIAAAQTLLDETGKLLEAGGSKLESAQGTVNGNLEQIWYKLGQMEDEEPELEEKREQLLEEADELSEDKEAAEELKEDERKLSSTTALLKGYDGIKSKLDAGGELAASAAEYADEYYSLFNRNHVGRLAICILEIVGGVLGFLCIPAAYEKSKGRFLLIAPAVLSFVCAAAAEIIALALNLGQCYAAMPTMLFAVIYLIFAIPKNKLTAAAEAE